MLIKSHFTDMRLRGLLHNRVRKTPPVRQTRFYAGCARQRLRFFGTWLERIETAPVRIFLRVHIRVLCV